MASDGKREEGKEEEKIFPSINLNLQNMKVTKNYNILFQIEVRIKL